MAKKDIELEKKASESSKSKKNKQEQKDGAVKRFFKGIAKWFRELKSEFKKVVWPSKSTVITNTLVVLVVMLVSAAFVGGMDMGFLELMELALGGKG
ncbi:MAG: preprotein translocase subunit SecE [Ruminococcus sp.]|nr:preprotein translocase subunit SecE [Ruminococcus sp.]MBQ8906776.1 preprotein translocase subunit SecE [Ruminococcus sp.]